MSTLELIGWIALMLFSLAGSAVCSGAETGAYTLNRIRLHVLDRRGDPRARRLHRLIADPTILISTLLIGNNLMNYVGTASLAVVLEAQGLGTWQSIILNTIIVTPMLFIFSEALPKDLFSVYSDRLMYPLAPVLTWLRWLFTATGLVPLVRLFTAAILRSFGHGRSVAAFHPRRQVETLVKEGVGYGLLSDEQSALVQRVMELAQRTVAHEMIPWSQVITLRDDAAPASLWNLASRTSRSRFPVIDHTGKVVGILDITAALVHDAATCPPIRQLMNPAAELPADMSVRQAMRRMRKESWALTIIRDADGKQVGIVTMKDLVEAITGELISW